MVSPKTYSTLPGSALDGLVPPVAVVCHDAGAANLVIGWLRHYGGEVRPCMAGPARNAWLAAFPDSALLDLEASMIGAATVLTGTGWASDFEHRARRAALHQGLRSIAVIDHWVNYQERFLRARERVLPDEIWVGDEDAALLARKCFPDLPVRQLPNLYLELLVEEVFSHKPAPARSDPREILYVLEPIRHSWGSDPRPAELQAFGFFIEYLRSAGLVDHDTTIRLRPHPSDPEGKYDAWLTSFPGVRLVIDSESALARQIAQADWVVGCESFALVIALCAGRIVMSTMPPWAPRCRLPHKDLIHLRDIAAPQ